MGRVNELKQRLAAVSPNWNEILTKNTTRPIIKGGMDYRAGFVSEAGDYYEAYPEHEPFLKDIITKHGDKKLINTYMPKGKKLYEGDIYNKWMEDTGMIRTRFDSFAPAIHTETDPTDAQRKTIGKFLKDSNIDKHDIVFEYGKDNFTGVEDIFDYSDPASSSGHDSIRDRIRSRHSKLKQRLQKVAYKGMVNRRGPQNYEEALKGSHSDTMADTIQKGFNKEETRKKILDRIDPTELPHKQEVTCGASSEHCLEDWENIVEDGNIGGIEKIKGVGGIYTGPGAEHSLNRLNLKSKKKEVGHAWLELPDKTIIDASVGQFINPKHEPLKQRQRFRIIPKESGLYKYYKKDPLLTHHLHMDDPERQVRRRLRKLGIDPFDPFPSRKAKLKQRLSRLQQ